MGWFVHSSQEYKCLKFIAKTLRPRGELRVTIASICQKLDYSPSKDLEVALIQNVLMCKLNIPVFFVKLQVLLQLQSCYIWKMTRHLFICRWKVTDWTPCTKSCGGGIRKRDVACIQRIDNVSVSVNSTACLGEKPDSRETCNNHLCYNHWHRGRYSEVSA